MTNVKVRELKWKRLKVRGSVLDFCLIITYAFIPRDLMWGPCLFGYLLFIEICAFKIFSYVWLIVYSFGETILLVLEVCSVCAIGPLSLKQAQLVL